MKEIGDVLKAARERQGLTIEDVAERTKIHRYKLEAIEAGQQELMPAKVFAIGLIKSYARELKVDSNTIDNLCKQAFAEPEDEAEVTEELTDAEPINSEPPKSPTTHEPPPETQSVGLFQIPKIIAMLISFAFIILLSASIYFIAQKMNSYSEEEAQASGIMDFEQKEISGRPEEPSEDAPSVESTASDQTPKEAEPEKAKPATDKVAKITAEDTSQLPEKPDTTELGPEIGSDLGTEDDGADPTPSGLADQKLNIRALEPVRIEVIWSDGYNQGLMLKRDESKTLVFSSPIKVRIDNGGAVEIRFNDKNQGVPGPLNKAIELKYP